MEPIINFHARKGKLLWCKVRCLIKVLLMLNATVAAALLLGLKQQNFHPLLIVAGFFQVLSEEQLPSQLEAELREGWQ